VVKMSNDNLINKLNQVLLNQMLEDLRDPQKCTPGLYQVVRGIISDNRDQLDSIPTETLNEVEEILSNTPFKFG
tara:strand:- start:2172 stop:2393 length:222 start_codon:yes stop_codon:yes gene_type:complete